MADQDEIDNRIKIWKHAVDIAMHFNDMSSRSRRLGLTFVAALLSSSIFFLKGGDKSYFAIPIAGYELTLHVSFLLSVFAALSVNVMKVLDINLYHSMLRGAVAFGEDIENLLRKDIIPLEKGLMQSISHFSRYSDAKVEILEDRTNHSYTGHEYKTAEQKLTSFYRRTSYTLYAVSLILLITTTTVDQQCHPVKNDIVQEKVLKGSGGESSTSNSLKPSHD